MKSTALAALSLLVALTSGAAGREKPRVVLMPVALVSGSSEAAAKVADVVRNRAAARGWSAPAVADVERFVEEHRVRYLDSLPQSMREEMLAGFDADAIVFTTLLSQRDGANPLAAVSARMIDREGRVIWGDAFALSANESETLLGLGRPRDGVQLAAEVASRVASSLPKPRRRPRVKRGPAPLPQSPVTYRSGELPKRQRRRICLVPLTASAPHAARVSLELLAIRLASNREFEIVEAADFRTAMRAEKLTSIGALTSDELRRIGKHIGTTVFLRGTVHTWREASAGRSEVQLDMTLADVESGTILWAVTHGRRGSEYAGFFQRGVVENVIALADRVISESVQAQRQKRPARLTPAQREARNERH